MICIVKYYSNMLCIIIFVNDKQIGIYVVYVYKKQYYIDEENMLIIYKIN